MESSDSSCNNNKKKKNIHKLIMHLYKIIYPLFQVRYILPFSTAESTYIHAYIYMCK